MANQPFLRNEPQKLTNSMK